MPDTGPSRLLSLNIPSVLDLRRGGIDVTYAASVSDPDGIQQVTIWYDRSIATSTGVYSFQIIHGWGNDWDDGSHSYTRNVLPHNIPGPLNITSVEITDDLGNRTSINAADLQEMGIGTSITVHSIDPDTTAPVLTKLDLPDTIDLSTGHAFADFSAWGQDSNEIKNVVVSFDREIIRSYGSDPTNFSSYDFIGIYGNSSDDWNDGSSTSDLLILEPNAAGVIDVDYVLIEDVYGNQRIYSNDDLRALGFDTSIEITGSMPAPVPQARVEMLPEAITIREGQSLDLALTFAGMENHWVSYSYYTSTSGGTAGAGDFRALSGNGSLSIVSTSPTTRTVPITLVATGDGIRESTENFFLVVDLGGSMRFADGGSMQVVEVRIVDDNFPIGTSGNDTLRGTSGAEDLIGGRGNDLYLVTAGDRVIEAAGEGTDVVHSPLTWSLSDNVENMVLTGSARINGYGNALNNHITGNAAANLLNGGGGRDTLVGGAGNDTYVTDGSDTIAEAAGGGLDEVRSSVSHSLGANLENLILIGMAAINGTGNGSANLLFGNGAANILEGGADNDTIRGFGDDDSLRGGAGNDRLFGNDGSDLLEGGDGDDMMLGLADSDMLQGGNGNDVLYGGEGNDSIEGDAGEDFLAGEVENDSLNGGAGRDRLRGDAGNDLLDGGDDNDTLQGGEGDDAVFGGSGDDIVYAGSGNDSVQGGSANDFLSGDAGNDTLWGGAGNDRMMGFDGNDLLQGEAGNDTMRGGLGIDMMIGGDGDDVLYGDPGNDYLQGGAGDDILVGGAGADVFLFDGGRDRVADFQDDIDRIEIAARFAGPGGTAASLLEDAYMNGNVAVLDFGAAGRLAIAGVTSLSQLNDDLVLV